MASQTDVREVERDKVTKKRKFDTRDFNFIAEYIVDELRRREKKRADKEKHWEEIDRQLRMEPDVRFKKVGGKPDRRKQWMTEMELPLQAQTLEVLTSDARRMMFPDSGMWFNAHAAMEDKYLDENEIRSLFVGEQADLPSVIVQDNIDKIAEGYLGHIHRQYDFASHIDQINAESFKYGMGVGRVRLASKSMFIHTARGVSKETRMLPVLFPRSIRQTYLDDSPHALMNEGMIAGPLEIHTRKQKFEDLILAAKKGGADGGWMTSGVSKIQADDKGLVEVIEAEGDLIVPRKTVRSIFIPGAIVTVIVGSGDSARSTVIRFRFRKEPFSSYLKFPYHEEDVGDPYGASPLMKGRLVQHAAAQALNRMMDAAALKNAPPIGYNKDDPAFSAEGPVVAPYQEWETTDGVTVHDFADPVAMSRVYLLLIQQYADVTGVNAPRLGAQTVSHTTAFAKEAELNRGTVRTVDYVRSSLKGPLTRFLHMEYEMARKSFRGEEIVYIAPYRGFLRIDKDALPETVTFEAFGSGGPAEEQQKRQEKFVSMQAAIQLDTLRVQQGQQPILDHAEIMKQILTEGGWTDVDPFINDGTGGVPAGTPESPGVAAVDGQIPGIASTALPTQ